MKTRQESSLTVQSTSSVDRSMLPIPAPLTGPAKISHSSTQQLRVTQVWYLLLLYTVAIDDPDSDDSDDSDPTRHAVAKEDLENVPFKSTGNTGE